MEILIEYNDEKVLAKIIKEYKVEIITDKYGVIELDQCKECGVWVGVNEELYGDGYCTACAAMCSVCKCYFNYKDMISIGDGYSCKKCKRDKDIKELKKASICEEGCSKFIARQRCYHDIIVDNDNNFIQNDALPGQSSIYESEIPYGPYTCVKCGKEYDELPKNSKH